MDHAVGDQVLLSSKNMMLKHVERSRKLMPRWVGPFKVLQKVGNLVYRLERNPGWRIHPVFHVSLLEPYHSNGRVQPPPILIELEGYNMRSNVYSITVSWIRNGKSSRISSPGRVMD
jgi:hypothetical protein